MTFQQFKESLKSNKPPSDLPSSLMSLWYDANGDWYKAHLIAQEIEDTTGFWIHGYLHRKEGDLANALYWYSRAGKKMPEIPLSEEWDFITQQLLLVEK